MECMHLRILGIEISPRGVSLKGVPRKVRPTPNLVLSESIGDIDRHDFYTQKHPTKLSQFYNLGDVTVT